MRKKEKFIYNTHTLRYEKVEESVSTKVFRVFGFVCAALLTAFFFTLISHRYFPSPKEKALLREIDRMEDDYRDLVRQMENFSEELNHLQDRDAFAHRMIFGMDPIDNSVWDGGVGGHNQFADYKQYKNAGVVMAFVQQKLQKS